MVVWQIFQLTQISDHQPSNFSNSSDSAPKVETTQSETKSPNVYHIVFDGYSSQLFSQLASKIGLTEELEGFTFFPKNFANYLVTDASVPSYLTGRLFKGGSFKEFQLNSKDRGLAYSLHESGYKVTVYAPNKSRFWSHNKASQTFTSADISVGSERDKGERIFAQVLMVRIAPEILRNEVSKIANRLVWGKRKKYAYYRRLSVPLFEKFLKDEQFRSDVGNYSYVHLVLPHAPYVWSGPECKSVRRTDFIDQSICATQLFKRFILKLKELGRYKNSIIVLQSDHGTHQPGNSSPWFIPPSKEVIEKMWSRHKYFEKDGIFPRLQSLLLIKPPSSEHSPLRIANEITQLADIPSTVIDLLGLPPIETDGQPVFTLPVPGGREIFVYGGIYTKDKNGQSIVLGKKVNKTSLAQFGYKDKVGWRILPEVSATHEGW